MSRSGFRQITLAAALTIFAIAPLLHPGYPIGQSGLLPVYNLASLIHDGPGNWQMIHGDSFAYGSFLPYYLLAALRFLSLDPYILIKVLFAASLALSGIAMYLLARSFFARWYTPLNTVQPTAHTREYLDWAAWLAAALYVYAPYRLASTYVLGDLGEAMVFPLLPLAGWCLLKSSARRGGSRILWAALSGAGFLAILLSGSLFRFGTPEVAGAVNAYVNLPALLSPVWANGATPATGLPVQLGVMAIVLGFTAIVATLSFPSLPAKLGTGTKLLFATAVLMVLLVLPWSAIAWSVLGRLVEAPFRLLGPLTLITALLGGSVILFVENVLIRDREGSDTGVHHLSIVAGASSGAAAIALIVLAIASSYAYLPPAYIESLPPNEPVNARFGSELLLLDYHLEAVAKQGDLPSIRPGTSFTLTLVWQDLSPTGENLTVFTHLIDSAGKVWAQQDNQPVKGQRPTSTWQTGNVVFDAYELTAKGDVPPGEYLVEIGLYDGATGERKTVVRDGQSDNRVVLGKLRVAP